MPPPVRDLVFISYSHRDAAWLEPIRTLLKPFTREGVLRVWADPHIEVGEFWEQKIREAIDGAAVGVLLVSGHFHASDFIAEKELPPLLDAAGRGLLTLVCVPVGPSAYQSPALDRYQWAHPPGEPLSLLADAARDQALARVVQAVVAAAQARSRPAAPAPAPREAEPAAAESLAVPAAGPAGALHGVPDLPPHFLPRSAALAGLKKALFDRMGRAVGITGAAGRVGVHGMGGIGKTVLATALAHDPEVRRAFPDGVFWIALGQDPDLPPLQARLARAAGGEAVSVTTVEEGREILRERLAGRVCLLVIDDVWDVRHARAFDVAGPRSRLLVTTRDGAVLTALGAREQVVGELPGPEALKLLASWARQDADRLPPAAHGVAKACGFLPLALAVAGARVRDGVRWADVLEALRRGELEFLDHPHGSVFRSLRASVDALPPGERQRYLELAVFPEDARVPEAVVVAYWRRTGALEPHASRALLARLQRLALLKASPGRVRRPRAVALVGWVGRRELLRGRGRGPQRDVALHDLQQDFVRIVVEDVPSLHGALLEAMAGGLPSPKAGAGWPGLPAGESYPWAHGSAHLVAAGRSGALRELLLDARWQMEKLRAAGLPTLLTDFDWFAGDPELDRVARALRSAAHVLADDPGQLPGQLLGRLAAGEHPRIRALLETAGAAAGERTWLRPLRPSLASRGSGLLRTLNAHSAEVMAAAFTVDGRWVVSAARDATVRVVDPETGKEARAFEGHAQAVRALAAGPGGEVATGSDDGVVKVWHPESGRVVAVLDADDAVGALAFARGGRLVAGRRDSTLIAWELPSGKPKWEGKGEGGWVHALACSRDGRMAVSGSRHGVITVRDARTGRVAGQLRRHASDVSAVALTADGVRAVSASLDGSVKVWDVMAGEEIGTLQAHMARAYSVAVTDDGLVLAGSENGWIRVWELETGREIHALRGHAASIGTLAVSPDGRRAVSGAEDGTLKVWDLDVVRAAGSAGPERSPVLGLAVSPDGRLALSGSQDGSLALWDVETGRKLHGRRSRSGPVRQVVFGADGRTALARGGPGRAREWNVESRRLVLLPERRDWKGYPAAEAPRPRRYARRISEVATETSWSSLALPNGLLLSAGDDGAVRVWTRAGRQLAAFAADAPVTRFTATPDGRTVVAADAVGRIHFLRLENPPGSDGGGARPERVILRAPAPKAAGRTEERARAPAPRFTPRRRKFAGSADPDLDGDHAHSDLEEHGGSDIG